MTCVKTATVFCWSSGRGGFASGAIGAPSRSGDLVLEILLRVRVSGQVEDLVEHQPVGRRCRARPGPVTTLEEHGQRFRLAAAVSDLHERSDDVAHHVLEE